MGTAQELPPPITAAAATRGDIEQHVYGPNTGRFGLLAAVIGTLALASKNWREPSIA
jgi:hypothetical protein